MADAMRNPEPLANQELETDVHFDNRIEPIAQPPSGNGVSDAGVLTERRNVVEWRTPADRNVKDKVADAASSAKERASAALKSTGERVSDTFRNTRQGASRTVRTVRQRSRFYLQKYPLEVIGVAAGVGFTAGVLLRIWRSSRYER